MLGNLFSLAFSAAPFSPDINCSCADVSYVASAALCAVVVLPLAATRARDGEIRRADVPAVIVIIAPRRAEGARATARARARGTAATADISCVRRARWERARACAGSTTARGVAVGLDNVEGTVS
jgi:hypothetical protein